MDYIIFEKVKKRLEFYESAQITHKIAPEI